MVEREGSAPVWQVEAGLAAPRRSVVRRWWRKRGVRWLTGYAFLLPALAVMGVFHFWPIIETIRLSFYHYNIVNPAKFAGLANYRKAFSDPVLGHSLRNTVEFTVVVVPILVIWPLILALVANRAIRGINWYRTLFYIPVISPMVVAALLWKQIVQHDGLLNGFLLWLHVIAKPVPWLTNPRIALFTIMGLTVWKASAYYMVIYLAGLQGIPRELEEAAMIDGANTLQRIWAVTIPLLRPHMALVAIISFIGCTQVFDEIYLVTQGGPGDATRTLVFYVYNTAFQFFDVGYAITISVLMLVVVLALSVLILRVFERE